MKIKIDRKVFADALSEVAPFAPVKAPIAILKNAKITTKGNRMKIEANDTQNSMTKYIETLECDENGTFLIPIAELSKFIARVKSDEITIEVIGDTVIVDYGKGTADFQMEKSDEFPSFQIPNVESTELDIPASLMREAIVKGKNFVSNETLRPQMCAIYAYVKDGEFGFCATDTHKMITSHDAFNAPAPTTDVHFYIMPAVFNTLSNMCKADGFIKVTVSDRHVTYRIGSVVVQTIQAQGAYPNFNRVIPQTWNMECAVDKGDLLDALGRVSMFSDNSEMVKVIVSRMDMTLMVTNLDFGKSANESLAHNGCNGDITIGLNVEHLMQSLGAFSGGDVLMRMDDASRPVVFKHAKYPQLTVLTMPMTIAN